MTQPGRFTTPTAQNAVFSDDFNDRIITNATRVREALIEVDLISASLRFWMLYCRHPLPATLMPVPISFAPLDTLPRVMRSSGVEADRCLVITDEHVAALYGDAVCACLASERIRPHLLALPPGEATKSHDRLLEIYDQALAWGLERGVPVVALGGGVVGDLAGFAAATLLRGLPLFQVPTTLIAQVDSSIGGKTGINHATGKNLIGAFYRPAGILTDTTVLQSLPSREWTSGLAEAFKHGLIADETLFAALETAADALFERNEEVVRRIVPRAADVKVQVVREDEFETGRRAILNFGHTFAHAIEKVAGYGVYTHGEAVAAGMRAALYLSGQVSAEFDPARADRLVGRIPVPPGLASLGITDLMNAMKQDKKVRGGAVRLVLLERIGRAFVTGDVPSHLVEKAWAYAQDVVG